MQIVDTGDRLAIVADDDVAFVHSRFLRRAVPLYRNHAHAAFDLQTMKADEAARKRDIRPGNADRAASDLSVLKKLPDHKLCGVDAGSKAEPLRRHDDRRVDADDFTAGVTSGPPELP